MPQLSRNTWSSLARFQACPASTLYTRKFVSSTRRSKVGPESPKFIEIPLPPQRYAPPPKNIKGVLPIPRNIFPRRAGDKTSPEYLANATREPTAHHQLAKAENELVAWKRRMAASRRQNLRDGLVELHRRKLRNDKTVAYRSAIKRENRELRVHAPPPEHERLTSPTITAAVRKLQVGNVPDPKRQERLALNAERVAARTKQLEEQRRDALHTLYMHARDFITTETQLDKKIDDIFVERPWAHVPGKEHAINIWDAEGPPLTVQDMLTETISTSKSAAYYRRGAAEATGKRMWKIAEELTGGKMD